MIVVLLLAVTIAAGGSLLVGVYLGTLLARHRPAPHEALAAVYEPLTPGAILDELRGPLRGRRG